MNVKVGVSNRHVHLKEEDYKNLFKDIEIIPERPLNQKGEYASNLKLTIMTEKGKLENVRIIYPLRDYTQVEISRTDSYTLGLNPPVRSSGDVSNGATVNLIGPKGSITTDGCIIANRHIHITEDDIKKYNIEGIEKVSVIINSEKGGRLDNVYLKADDSYTLELHIDTDDANAMMLKSGDEVEVVGN